MKKTALLLALVAAPAAYAQVEVVAPAPMIRFEAAPPLVEVEPGVQVVPDRDEEIFFHDGYYWTRRDNRWWRTRDYHGGWAYVGPRYVPPALVRVPAGRYHHWHAGAVRREEHREAVHEERAAEHREAVHEERAAERHEVRHEEHREAVHQERKEERREERHDER